MTRVTAVAALWRQRRLFVGISGLFLLAGVLVTLLIPKTYQATATIYLDTSRNNVGFDLGLQSAQLLQHDFIVLAGKRAVLSHACATPRVRCTPAELANPETELTKRISVTTDLGTSLLSAAASAPTADEAEALANAVATAMIIQDANEVNRMFKLNEDSMTTQLANLQSQITDEQQALLIARPDAASNAAIAAHTAALSSLTARYTALEGRHQDLLAQKDRLLGMATVVEPAAAPTKPSVPDPVRYILAALVVGLAAGLLAALIRQRFDHRLFDPESLAIAAGTPIVTLIRPGPQGHQSYARTHANLLARHPETRRVMVVAASPGDRSDLVARGLGDVAAEAGCHVFLMQSDGVSMAAAPSASPSGNSAGITAVTVQQGRAVSAAFIEAAGQYDFALLAVPSPELSPESLPLAGAVDQAILVATAGKTEFQQARRVAELIRQTGGSVAASVLLSNGGRRSW